MITIKFIEADVKRYLKALVKLNAAAMGFGQQEMQRRCAVDYYQLLVKNIMSKMVPKPSYSPRYARWKKKYGRMGFPSPWRLKGDIVASLSAFPAGKGWMGGIPIGAMDSGGKSWLGKGDKGRSKPIAMYGSVMEHGGSYGKGGTHPPRPVFGPTAKEYARAGWQKRGQEALNKQKAAWA